MQATIGWWYWTNASHISSNLHWAEDTLFPSLVRHHYFYKNLVKAKFARLISFVEHVYQSPHNLQPFHPLKNAATYTWSTDDLAMCSAEQWTKNQRGFKEHTWERNFAISAIESTSALLISVWYSRVCSSCPHRDSLAKLMLIKLKEGKLFS